MPRKILIDADAFVSLANKKDSGHSWAKEIKERVVDEDVVVYLSSFAYGEAITVVSMQLGLKKAGRMAELIERGNYVLVDVDGDLRREGLEWFKKQSSKNSRFTDCVNMALMKERGIKEVFSRDEHYQRNGFVRLGVDDK